jgi:hypothetical protein
MDMVGTPTLSRATAHPSPLEGEGLGERGR